MLNTTKKPERLFPFIKRARALIVGQQVILRSKSQLQFVLLTHDISDRGKSEALRKFKHYPIVQHFRSADIHEHFDLRGVKLIGFRKSGLSKSLYAELKKYRINEPVVPKREEEPTDSSAEDSASTQRSQQSPGKASPSRAKSEAKPRALRRKSP